MKITLTCPACSHEVELQEDDRIRVGAPFTLTHRADGGHEYTVGVKVGLGFGGSDARR